MVEARNIVKSFGAVRALKGVSFEAAEGEIFGLIGPDGAGKTTLIRILATLLLPDGGEVRVDGFDAGADFKAIRSRIGYMPGRFSLYQDLSVEENLRFFATVFDSLIAENYHLIRDIYEQLKPFKTRRAGALSGGMKQKLALCCALVHKPRVLFLDEPTTGVDPVSRKELWEMLGRLKKEGITIIASTPYMDEAVLCDRIALMKGGAFLAIDAPEAIAASYAAPLFAVRGTGLRRLIGTLRAMPEVRSCYSFGDSLHVSLREGGPSASVLADRLRSLGHGDAEAEPIAATIEDRFMDLASSEGASA